MYESLSVFREMFKSSDTYKALGLITSGKNRFNWFSALRKDNEPTDRISNKYHKNEKITEKQVEKNRLLTKSSVYHLIDYHDLLNLPVKNKGSDLVFRV